MIKKKVTFFFGFFGFTMVKPLLDQSMKKLLASNGFVYTTLKK
ncbi:hypothetical protein QK912_10085 [Lactococcus lactis]